CRGRRHDKLRGRPTSQFQTRCLVCGQNLERHTSWRAPHRVSYKAGASHQLEDCESARDNYSSCAHCPRRRGDRMRRREFIAGLGGVAAWPLAAGAQAQKDKVYHIGILSLLKRPSEQVFRDAMHDLGYIEGRNVFYDVRYAEGNADQLPSLAAQLVRLNVDVMVTAGGPAAEAARQATTNVPIVLWGAGDPIGTGLITNASHPGGNLTGITELSTELTSKRLQLFKEAVPDLHRIAVLWNVGDRAMTLRFQEVETAAP